MKSSARPDGCEADTGCIRFPYRIRPEATGSGHSLDVGDRDLSRDRQTATLADVLVATGDFPLNAAAGEGEGRRRANQSSAAPALEPWLC